MPEFKSWHISLLICISLAFYLATYPFLFTSSLTLPWIRLLLFVFHVVFDFQELQEEITTSAAAKSVLSKEFIRDLVMDHLAADVTNKTSELNLTVASHISDCILDEVINAVEKSVQSLVSTWLCIWKLLKRCYINNHIQHPSVYNWLIVMKICVVQLPRNYSEPFDTLAYVVSLSKQCSNICCSFVADIYVEQSEVTAAGEWTTKGWG